MVEGSAAVVMKVWSWVFPVVEVGGEVMPGERPLFNLLGGIKARVSESLLLGLAFQAPVTSRTDYLWQLVVQAEVEFGKMIP